MKNTELSIRLYSLDLDVINTVPIRAYSFERNSLVIYSENDSMNLNSCSSAAVRRNSSIIYFNLERFVFLKTTFSEILRQYLEAIASF